MVEMIMKGCGGYTDYFRTWKEAESAAWSSLAKTGCEEAVIRDGVKEETVLYGDAMAVMGGGYIFDGKIAPRSTTRR